MPTESDTTADIVTWLRAKGHPRLANDLEARGAAAQCGDCAGNGHGACCHDQLHPSMTHYSCASCAGTGRATLATE